MIEVTNMFDILDIEEVDRLEMTPPVSDKSATEIIESEIEEDIQAHRAQDLLERLVEEGQLVKAKKVVNFMEARFGIEANND